MMRIYGIKRLNAFLNRLLPISPGIMYAFGFKGFDTVKTWHGERAVEIAIVLEMVKKYQGMNILEIGNVLSHHVKFEHDVLDKYEIAKGVINEDIVDFKSDKKYDLIVSVSTIEHVGWDEKPRDNMKILRAIENLKTIIVSRGGTI